MVNVAVAASTELAVRVGAAGVADVEASETGPAPVEFVARTLNV